MGLLKVRAAGSFMILFYDTVLGRSHKYFYALPYPSAYHYHEKLVTFPWAVKQSNEGDSSVVSMDAINRARPIVALFIGSVKTYNSVSNKLRCA